MIKLTVQRIVGERPYMAREGWFLFNAPRPMYGTETFQNEFRHGIFYGSIDPRDPGAAQMMRDNVSLDGWLCEYVTKDQVMEWAKGESEKWGYDISDFDWRDILASYYENNGRVTRTQSIDGNE